MRRARSARPPRRPNSSNSMISSASSASTSTSELDVQSPAPASSRAESRASGQQAHTLGGGSVNRGCDQGGSGVCCLCCCFGQWALLPFYGWSYLGPAWYFFPGVYCVRKSCVYTAMHVSSFLFYPARVGGLAFLVDLDGRCFSLNSTFGVI